MKIIYISALWCSSCLVMRPTINELKSMLKTEIIEYDYDLNEDIVKKFEVGTKIPVLIVLKNDEEILRITGEHKLHEILKRLSEVNLDETI